MNKVGFTREYELLKNTLDKLSKHYINLIEEKEELEFKHKKYLECKYLGYFGYLIEQKFKLEIDIRKIKKKMSMIRRQVNRGNKPDLESIENILEKEMFSFYNELNEFRESISESREYLESPNLTSEEISNVKKIFRNIAKQIHPDMKKDFSEKDSILWERANAAYRSNDVVALESIENIILSDGTMDNLSYDDIPLIEERIEKIRVKIIYVSKNIEKTKENFPFDIEKEMESIEWVQRVKKSMVDDMKILLKEKEELEELLKKLLEDI